MLRTFNKMYWNDFTDPVLTPIDSSCLLWRHSKPKNDVRRRYVLIIKVNDMWNHNETRLNSYFYIFGIVIINIYITHSILHWVHYNLISFYEFATNRNLTCAELMRKAYQVVKYTMSSLLNDVISLLHVVVSLLKKTLNHVSEAFFVRILIFIGLWHS